MELLKNTKILRPFYLFICPVYGKLFRIFVVELLVVLYIQLKFMLGYIISNTNKIALKVSKFCARLF